MLILVVISISHVENMEDNLLKQEGQQQKMSDGRGFDITELSGMLCDLDAVATQVGSIRVYVLTFLVTYFI